MFLLSFAIPDGISRSRAPVRVTINDGEKAGQEVFHLHMHLIGEDYPPRSLACATQYLVFISRGGKTLKKSSPREIPGRWVDASQLMLRAASCYLGQPMYFPCVTHAGGGEAMDKLGKMC